MTESATASSASARRTPFVFMGVLVLLWGSVFLWVEVALHSYSPLQITAARTVLGALVLLVYLRWRREPLPRGPRTWVNVSLAAVLTNVVPFTLFAVGQRSVDSGTAGILNATTPLWTLALSVLIGIEHSPGALRVGGFLVGLVGVTVVLSPWDQGSVSVLGATAILGGAISYAVSFVFVAARVVGRGYSAVALSAAQLLVAAAITLVGAAVWTEAPTDPELAASLALVVLGVLGTGVTLAMFVALVAREGAASAATVTYLLPVVALALGVAVLDEPVQPLALFGAAVVLVGVAMSRRTSIPGSGSGSQRSRSSLTSPRA